MRQDHCSIRMVWADYTHLINPSFFLISKDLADIEFGIDQRYVNCLYWSRRVEYPWAVSSLYPYNKTEVVLDVGSDGSPLPYYLAQLVRKTYGLDNGPDSVEFMVKAVEKLKLNNMVAVLGDARKLDFPADFFDKVFCISVVEHIEKGAQGAIDEIVRVTKPTGKAAITLDVIITKSDRERTESLYWDYSHLMELAQRYAFVIQAPSDKIMQVKISNAFIQVACLLVEGKKDI